VAGVDLWRVHLDVADPGAAAILAPEERARAARFALEHHRRRFLVGRATVRRILAGHVGRAPESLAFVAGAHGKPSLPGGPPFSFSNAQGCGLLGVGRAREIGVDLECLREVPDAAGVAGCAFTPDERAAWLAAGGDGSAFLRVWTRKEAALKALGVGLAGEREATAEATVHVLDLDFYPEHAAALAIAGPVRRG
jgi:4'-phosphopantetheinyl transferase